MTNPAETTEAVVRSHLEAFLEQRGIPAILADYDERACFITEQRIHRGKREIGIFFEEFIAALPPQAIQRFSLRSCLVDADIAHITWSVGTELPLGTDTFVVRGGKIVAQTFAMSVAKII